MYVRVSVRRSDIMIRYLDGLRSSLIESAPKFADLFGIENDLHAELMSSQGRVKLRGWHGGISVEFKWSHCLGLFFFKRDAHKTGVDCVCSVAAMMMMMMEYGMELL